METGGNHCSYWSTIQYTCGGEHCTVLPSLQSVNQSGCRLAGRQISILDFALISGPTSGCCHHVDVIIVVVAIIVTKLFYSKALSSVRNIFPFPWWPKEFSYLKSKGLNIHIIKTQSQHKRQSNTVMDPTPNPWTWPQSCSQQTNLTSQQKPECWKSVSDRSPPRLKGKGQFPGPSLVILTSLVTSSHGNRVLGGGWNSWRFARRAILQIE